MMKRTLDAKNALLWTLMDLLVVHKSLRNRTYGGICYIMLRRGMLILTWEKVSPILLT